LQGLTIAHLMACVGRPDELSLITQAVQKVMDGLVPLGQKVFKRCGQRKAGSGPGHALICIIHLISYV
jgi:hypothetical protein